MLSGRRLDLLDPSPLDVEIEDIAHGLARVARWNGQTEGAHIFSVAQHTLLVDALARTRWPRLDRRARLSLLLHDAPEYVIGDMISPFKAVIGDNYKARRGAAPGRHPCPLRAAGQDAAEIGRLVKTADHGAAFLEATRLAGFAPAEARRFFGPPPRLAPAVERDHLTPWSAGTAEKRYLERFALICPRRLLMTRRLELYPGSKSEGSIMIHVCSLARLHDTVAETGASHIVTLLRTVDLVERPRSIAPATT